MRKLRLLTLAALGLIALNSASAQVGIGVAFPNSRSILDLTNSNSKGLMLPSLTSTPASGADTTGLLFYYYDALYFRDTVGYNIVNAWKYKYNGSTTEVVTFNPSSYVGVGVGVSDANVKGNLHVSLNSKEVDVSGTSAAIFIGNDDAGTHMIFDNDEILVKTSTTAAGILKLQEGGGTVQVGESITNTSTLNVYGKVQENGKDLVPKGAVIMWSGAIADIPAGWGLCDGKWYNPTDMSVGQTGQASSDASHTVQTPNLTDKFVPCAGGSTYTVGQTGGSDSNSHTHAIDPPNTSTTTNGAHTHTGTTGGPSGTYDPAVSLTTHDVASDNHTHSFTTDSGGSHSHTVNIASFTSGTSTTTDNRPSYIALAYIMKLK